MHLYEIWSSSSTVCCNRRVLSGFDQGVAVDLGSTSGSNSTPQHGRDDRVAAVGGGENQDDGQQNAPPPYSEVLAVGSE